MIKIKLLSSFICILTAVFILNSCERDDICAPDTVTTPLLIIRFIDFESGVDSKIPTDLRILSTDPDITEEFPINVGTDSIAIPLKTNGILTEFEFTINANDQTKSKSDLISFQYTPEEQFVSSACGFKINYLGLTANALEPDINSRWVKEIKIINNNVIDETAAHISILH